MPVAELAAGRVPADVTLDWFLEDWAVRLTLVEDALAADADRTHRIALTGMRALSPLPRPPQIFCAGANYGKHVVEMVIAHGAGPLSEGMDTDQRRSLAEAHVAQQKIDGAPYIFMKTVSSVAGPCDPLKLVSFSNQLDWELELGVVIARDTYQVSREDALSCVAGYMIVNDVTARDKVKRPEVGAMGPDWLASKGGPGFLPTGPYLVPAKFVADPQNLAMRLSVNGEIMQDDTTADMTFNIARQIEFISAHVRLLAGDLLCTGSPAGNGVARGIFLKDGDVMEAEIEGLGRQRVVCQAAADQ